MVSNETNLNNKFAATGNAAILSPPDDMVAMQNLVDASNAVTAKMHIDRFGNYAKDIVDFIKGRGGSLNNWFNVAGGAYTRVAIHNDDNNVVFVVPAILVRQPTVRSANREDSIAGQLDKYYHLMSSSPIAAVRFLSHQFGSRPTEKVYSQSVIDDWNAILRYYNEEPLELEGAEDTSSGGMSMMTDDEEEELL